MNNHYYPTASNVSVFINGFHIDQAYRIDYRESSPKIPIYGYNDYRYGRVIKGNEVINGMIIINFIFSGYLNALLDRINKSGNNIDAKFNNFITEKYNDKYIDGKKVNDRDAKRRVADQMRQNLPSSLTAQDRLDRAEYIASLLAEGQRNNQEVPTAEQINRSITFADAVEATKWYAEDEDYAAWSRARPTLTDMQAAANTRRDSVRNTEIPSPLSINTYGNKKLNIDVYYQDPNLATWLVRFYDVYFTEINQQISQAGADGSSEPLYEIYNFLASHKETILVKG